MTSKVTTAKLVRGKNYSYNFKGQYENFVRNVPREVSDELADELEELVETIATEDGDEVEKEIFKIDRNADARNEDAEKPRKARMRLIPVEPKQREAPAARRPVGGLKRRVPA